MRLWIDGQCLQTLSRQRGIGRYVHELIGALATHCPQIELSLSFNAAMVDEAIVAREIVGRWIAPRNIHIWQGLAEGGEAFFGGTPRRQLSSLALAHHVAALAPDVALSASPFEGAGDTAVPLLPFAEAAMPITAIFYDAIPHRYPAQYLTDPGTAASYRRRLAAHAGFDALLGISQFATREAIDLFPAVAAHAIDAGPPSGLLHAHARPDIGACAGLPAGDPFLLYVGALDWRKNVAKVVDAFRLMDPAVKGVLNFVIAGAYDPSQAAVIAAQWRKCGLSPDKLVLLGRVSDDSLGQLYRSARLVIQPSLMEGFGLTALEAMTCGAPIITANTGALPEVVGDERALFDPHDASDMARRICDVTQD